MAKRYGLAVLEALSDPPAVVLMSAHHVHPAVMACPGNKIGAFVKKPFAPSRLIEEVQAGTRAGTGTGSADRVPLHASAPDKEVSSEIEEEW